MYNCYTIFVIAKVHRFTRYSRSNWSIVATMIIRINTEGHLHLLLIYCEKMIGFKLEKGRKGESFFFTLLQIWSFNTFPFFSQPYNKHDVRLTIA